MTAEKPVLQELDGDDLYRAETYTDRKAGTIQALVPVDKYGTRDPDRRVIYQSVVGVGGGPNGVQHLEFTIDDAITLSDAVELWSTAASKAIESAIKLAEKRRFEQSMLMGGSAAARIN